MRQRFAPNISIGFCSLLLLCSISAELEGQNCPGPLTERQKQTLAAYIHKRYNLPETVHLSLKRDIRFGNSCFRELTFEGKGVLKAWELKLYSSPDVRFLSSDLFDTTIDPSQEQRIKNEALMKGLVQGSFPTRGPDTAPVTIVEFSDFECPSCRKFALALKEVLPSQERDVRLVFHHMPLSIHPWARLAAEVTGCVQLQSNEAFWSLHDRILQNQTMITDANARDKLSDLAINSKGVDAEAFRKCLNSGMSVGLVLRDMNLADTYEVRATPTLFINGHRVLGVENSEKLREMIVRAKEEAASASKSETRMK